MIERLLTEHHLEFLSLKGGCKGSSESTLVKLLKISCQGSFRNVMRLNEINLITSRAADNSREHKYP